MALIAKKYHGDIVDLHYYGHIAVVDAGGYSALREPPFSKMRATFL